MSWLAAAADVELGELVAPTAATVERLITTARTWRTSLGCRPTATELGALTPLECRCWQAAGESEARVEEAAAIRAGTQRAARGILDAWEDL